MDNSMLQLRLDKKYRENILKEVQHNEISSIKRLKKTNPDFHWMILSYDQTGDTALHIAARLGHLTTIDYLLGDDFNPCLVDIRNKYDKTPLHEAAQFAQFENVSKLCSYGCDVNALKQADWTPLMLACTKLEHEKSLKIVKTLVANGAKLNVVNKDGWNCAHILAREGGDDILKFLISKDLKVTSKTKNGRTALHIASLHGNKETVNILLDYIDIEVRDGCGNTPLHEAVLGGNLHLVKFFISKGADVHKRNNNDMCALHLAASQNETQIVEYLIKDLKCDVDVRTKNGWSAAHCATRKGFKCMLEFLKDLGADIQLKDCYDRTPMDYLR